MDRMNPVYRCFGAMLLVALFAGSAAAYVVGDWTVVQLTDNATNDINPRVSGNTVVWSGMGDSSSWQVFMWQDDVTTQLTDNGSQNLGPQVGGDLVVWTADLDRIYSYDGTVQALTPSYERHKYPDASFGAAAWLGAPSGIYLDIYYYDGVHVARITDTNHQKYDVRVSGTSVVWWGASSNGTGEIYYYDGATVTQLTSNTYNDKNVRVFDGGPGDLHVTYESLISGYWDIMHFDDTNTVNLTNTPAIHEYGHQVCGNRTVWLGPNQGQNGIWLHDGASAFPISPVGMYVGVPQVTESLVTWSGTSWGEIYVYDGTVVTRLTDNGILADLDPQADGNTIVWHGNDGNDDEIFMAYKTPVSTAVPEAQSLTLFGARPNPFNPSTEILFSNSRAEALSVKIFDLRGRLVVDLGNRVYTPGDHAVAWHGRDRQGKAVPSGVYFYLVESDQDRQVGKLTLVE